MLSCNVIRLAVRARKARGGVRHSKRTVPECCILPSMYLRGAMVACSNYLYSSCFEIGVLRVKTASVNSFLQFKRFPSRSLVLHVHFLRHSTPPLLAARLAPIQAA